MKHTFSRLFVALTACVVCISMQARELNPFAFKLSSYLEGDIFNVTYFLNAPAEKVTVYINVNGTEIAYDCTNAKNTIGTTKAKGIYNVPISLRENLNNNDFFRGQVSLSWRVAVIGGNTASMPGANGKVTGTLAKEYAFYAPGGIDIDADPTSPNFGMIYCTETRTLKPGLTPDGSFFTQHHDGSKWIPSPGLYVFDAAFQNMPPSDKTGNEVRYDFVTPNNNRTFARAYNLGLSTTFNETMGASDQGYFYPSNTTYRTMAPRRVRLSADGRLFVSMWTTTGNVLKELNPARLRYDFRDANGNLKNSGWIFDIFKVGNGSLRLDDKDSDNSYTDNYNSFNANIQPTHIVETTGNQFVAAPNIGLDVTGKGANLKLFLASGDKGSAVNFYRESFYFNEYNLGTAQSWNKVPSTSNKFSSKRKVGSATTYTVSRNCIGYRSTTEGKPDTNGDGHGEGTPINLITSYDAVSFEYDQYGGVWLGQHRENQNENASIYHIKSDGTADYAEHITDRSRGAIRYTNDWKKLIVAGGQKYYKTIPLVASQKNYNYHDYTINGSDITLPAAELLWATLFDVTHPNAATAPKLSNPVYIELGQKPDDFAWDYAGNLYSVSIATQKVSAYALPNGGKPVSTPCIEQYYIDHTTSSTLTVKCIPTEIKAGTACDNAFQGGTMTQHNLASNGSFQFYYRLGAKFQLLGQPANGYRFYCWVNEDGTDAAIGEKVSSQSTMKEGGITRTAKFAIDVREDEAVATREVDVIFPGAFVQRALDNQSYSTICLPFHLKSLTGTAYEGATVLRFAGTTPSEVEGENKLFLNFEKVTFTGDDYMHAGVPYLIKVKDNIAGGNLGEKIFTEAQCPVIKEGNAYIHNMQSCTGNQHGGKSVTHNGVTFHGFINPTTFQASETNLFVTADNRLTTLYDEAKINGLRAYFSVSSPLLLSEIELNLPDEVTTAIPSIATQQAATKYLWNGKVHIQQNGITYDISGAHVK